MVAPIRFLTGRQQQQKIGVIGSTEDTKVLEVVGRVGIGTVIFEPIEQFDLNDGNAIFRNSVGIGTTNIFSGGNTNSLTLDGKIVVGNAIGSTNLSNVLSANVGTGVNAYRSFNLIDTSSVVKIVRASSFTAGSAIELQHWNENIDTQYGYWDLVSERGHFAFRDRINSGNEKNRIFISNNGNVLIGSTSGNIGISSDESVGFGTDNILQVNGNVYLGGDVGIGTTNPTKTLDVAGYGTSNGIRVGDTHFFAFGDGGSESKGSPTFQNLNTNNDTILRVVPNGTSKGQVEIFATDYFANAGIGTTTWDNLRIFPDNNLGEIRIETSAATEAGVAKSISIETNVDPGGGTRPNQYQLYLDVNGNIGLGTNTPLQKFQIGAANTLGISTDGKVFTVTSDGSVGIGTTNPQASIHIYRQDTVEGLETHSDFILENPGKGNARIFLKTRDNNRDWEFFADDNDGAFGIHDGEANRRVFTISTSSYIGIGTFFNSQTQPLQQLDVRGGAHVSGDVGIGSTQPTAKLDVNGTLNVSGVSTFQSNVHLLDSVELRLGTGSDLKIYHNGNNGFVSNVDTGDLNISGDDVIIASSTFENKAKFITDGAVELYHDNSKKFETTGVGVSIVNETSDTATIYGPSNLIIDPMPIGVGTTSGIVRIKGDLYVDGTQFTVASSTIELADFVVGIATTVPNDLLLDGAGIGIGTNKTFLYEYNSGNNPSLKSSENLNVASGKHYQIGETEVLSSTTLGSGVTNSSLTSLGTIATGVWQGTAINDDYIDTIDNADKVSLSALNIDGGTDIGALLSDGDLFIVDDGANGTNRKADVIGLTTYTFGKVSGDITISSTGTATIQADSVALGGDTTGQYASTITGGDGLTATTPNADDGTAYTIAVGAGTGITVNADDVAIKNADNLTDNKVVKWDDGNGQLTDSVITDDGTNVGIGSTQPTAKLHVEGNTYISGKLGIGITNPTSSLHLSGIGSTDPSAPDEGNRIRIGDYHWDDTYSTIHAKKISAEWWLEQNSPDNDGVDLVFYKSRGVPNAEEPVQVGDNLFRLTARAFTPNATGIGTTIHHGNDYSGDYAGQIVFDVDTIDGNNVTSSIDIRNRNESRLIVKADGKIGIGTTIPTAKLDVRGNLIVSGITTLGVTTASSLFVSGITTLGVTTASSLFVSGVSTFTDDINIGTGGTTAFFDISTGNIGIGTTIPTAKLDVNGTLNVSGITTLGITTASSLFVSGITTTGTLYVGASGTIGITSILDEDDMVSDSDTALATQQSIKAYVDSQVTAQDLDFQGDTGTGDVDLDSEVLTIAGTASEIETSASNQTLTIGLPNDVAITTSLVVGSATTITGSGIVAGIVTGTLDNTLTLGTSGNGISGSATYNNSGASTFTVTSNATSANTASTIVFRDSSGDFSAGTITANLTGTATTATNLSDGANITTGTISDDRLPDLITSNINIASGISSVATLDATSATIDNLTFTNGTAITGVNTDLTTVSASDNTLASAKAIKTYVDAQSTAQDLDFSGDTGNGAVDLDSQTFTIAGTANEIETVGSGVTLTIGLPNEVAITTSLVVGSGVTITGSTVQVGGTITELYNGQFWNVVTQADVGYGASQVPLNQYLGQLAFLDDHHPNGLRRDGGGSDDVFVNSSGLVGIGLTDPEKPLHVKTSVATPLIVQRTNTNNTAIEYRNNTSSVWAGLAGNALGWGVANAADVGGNAQILVTRTDGELLVNSTTSTGTASQKLQVTGGAYVSGKLGVGNTNPTARLDIFNDTTNDQEVLRIGGYHGNSGSVQGITHIGLGYWTTGTYSPARITVQESTTGSYNANLLFSTRNSNSDVAPTERMRISYDGSVGIGSTSPSEKLDVAGNIAINQTTVVGSATSSLSTVAETAIHTGLSTSTYRSVEYNIQATQGTNYHVTKILALHNGTTAYHNEYGTIYNNTSVATFDVKVSGGNMRLVAIGATSDQTDYVVNFTATKL